MSGRLVVSSWGIIRRFWGFVYVLSLPGVFWVMLASLLQLRAIMPPLMTSSIHSRRIAALPALALVLAVICWWLPPIHQDLAYHQFADQRSLMGIPNALNVLSNIPFAIIAAIALWGLLASTQSVSRLFNFKEKLPYLVFFSGVGATAFGSAYYHWQPSSLHLFWDRLPMSIAFMALLCAVIADRISPKTGLALLPLLTAFGAASVWYWAQGDAHGQGDLRPYVWVQFGGLILMLATALLFPARLLKTRGLVAALGWYAAAKVLESSDATIFHVTHEISGHSLKHVAAAMGGYWIYKTLAAGAGAQKNHTKSSGETGAL